MLCLPLAPAQGQQRPSQPGDFKIKNLKQYYRNTARYQASSSTIGGQGNWANEQWLAIDVDFASDLEWADDVLLKFYVLMGSGRTGKLFTGDLTLVNVEKGSSHFAAMFVHPSTLKRYGRGKVTAVAVQLYHQNRLLAQESDPSSRTRWWESYTPVPGYLLRPEASPWGPVAHERYEAIKATP